jgi:aminoglycoside 3-N-acetyltransferase
VTTQRLVRDLSELGVGEGQTLLVHSSLSSIGWVAGGAAAVVDALRQAVGRTGNVVVPTGTELNSQTSRAHQERTRGMTEDEIHDYVLGMPAFDTATTPGTAGAIAEELRTTPGTVRSAHPQSSLAAIGPLAEYLMADHDPHCHLGEDSPLAKLYKLGAHVLLLGAGYGSCTAFHLAEYRYRNPLRMKNYFCAVMRNGVREWEKYQDVDLDDGDFEVIGECLDCESSVKRGCVGSAKSRLIPLVNVVDFAEAWMRENRDLLRFTPERGTSK